MQWAVNRGEYLCAVKLYPILVKGLNAVEANENYGIHLASLTTIPESVVTKAREFVSRIKSPVHIVPARDS